MRGRPIFVGFVALVLAVQGWAIAGATSSGAATAATVTRVPALVTVKPLSQLAAENPAKASTATVPEGFGARTASPGPALPSAPDPVTQTTDAPAGDAPVTNPIVNFQAQNGGDPPDTVGDVGRNHYLQAVNSTIAVYNKTGTLQAGFPTNISSLWAGTTGQAECAPNPPAPQQADAGDPIVLYDQQVDRWMVSQFTDGDGGTNGLQPVADGTFPMCIAYSQTGDPTGNWFLYEFRLPRQHDYMKYGIWPDGLYMSTFEGNNLGIYVFQRSAMVSGSPAAFIDGGNITAGTGVNNRGNRILPADWDGVTAPPAGAPNYFVQSKDGAFDAPADRLEVFQAVANFAASPSPTLTFTPAATLPTAPFDTDVNCTNTRACINQAGTTNRVDAIANRLMHRLQYRNFGDHESMVVSQTVDADNNRAGIRWYELRKKPADPPSAWSIYQQGTYGPADGIERWMPSAAMDSKGDIAIGYSASKGDPSGISPDIRYTARTATDPLGSMTQGEHIVPLAVTNNSLTGSNRWGDYSAMTVDPVDDCTFWYTQMFISAGQTRSTQVAAFRFPSCADVDLHLTKNAPAQIAAGEDLPYSINVANGGTDAATNVVVKDQLPAGLQFDAASSSPACTEVPAASGSLTCTLGDLAPSQGKSLLIVAHVPANYLANGGSPAIKNTATVTADQSDTNPGDNTDDATTTVVGRADVAVTKLCQPDTPPQSVSGRCQIFVDNFGPSDAQSVTLTDSLVSNAPFTVTSVTVDPLSSGSCTATPTGIAPSTQWTVSCNLGTEPAGGRTTVTVSIQAPTGANVSDTATVNSSTNDPQPANNQTSASLAVSPSSDLKIEKEGPANATAGEQFNYTLTVTNNGPSPATNVVVDDDLPAQVTFVSVTSSKGNCGPDNSGDVQCNLGTIPPPGGPAGANSVTITIKVGVPADTADGTVLANTAQVHSDVADPNNDDNIDSVTTTVQTRADLSLQKFAQNPPFVAGTTVTYRYVLSNAGPSWSREVSLVDNLPTGTTFVSAFLSEGGQPVGGPLSCQKVAAGTNTWSCPLGDLAPTGSKPLEMIVNIFIASSVPEGTELTNSATATSDTNDPGGNSASVTITVATEADLGVVKTSDFDTYAPSATIKYTITVTNLGPSDSYNVVVTDLLPDTKQAIYRFDTANCAKADLTLTCNLGTMAAGSAKSFNVYVTVKGNKGVVTNTASADSVPTLTPAIDETHDPVSANNTSVRKVLIQGGISKK